MQDTKSFLHRYKTLLSATFVFFLGATFAFLGIANLPAATAAPITDFNAGNIISDAVMANYKSMTVAEIQAFLTAKNPCNNTDYDLYLDQSTRYPSYSWHWTGDADTGHFVCLSEELFGEGTEIGSGQTAAEIIYEAAQEYHINPQVLIVLLEKEQSLITDDFPNSRQYRSATGYGCPDTAACDERYYGLKNQVNQAAWLFRYTLDNGYSAYPEKTSGVFIAYNPSSYCGRSEVYIENRATAALYRYTPYQPNAAALAAGRGTGDSCSAYGNRNFYVLFTEWFGDPRVDIVGQSVILPDGIYGFAASDDIDLGLSIQSDGDVKLASDINLWQVERVAGTTSYTITDPTTGTRLDLSDGDTTAGSNIRTWSANTACAQRWNFYSTPDGYLIIESACDEYRVLATASIKSGANIAIADSRNESTEKWSIYTGDHLASDYVTISAYNNFAAAIDVAGGRNANGSNIQLYQANGQKSEIWQFIYRPSSDSYQIINPYYDRALDLADAKTVKNSNIQLYAKNSSCAQRWKVIPTLDGESYNILSTCQVGWAIDLPDGKTANSTNIRLWPTNNAKAQRWQLTPLNNIAEGIYTLTTKNNPNRAMDVADGRDANGTNIHIWDVNGAGAQDWSIEYVESAGAYRLINPATGRALDLADAKTVKNSNIQLYAKNSSCAQLWKFLPNADGYYTIASTCDLDYAIDLPDGETARRTNVRLWTTNKSNAQRWQLNLKSLPEKPEEPEEDSSSEDIDDNNEDSTEETSPLSDDVL